MINKNRSKQLDKLEVHYWWFLNSFRIIIFIIKIFNYDYESMSTQLSDLPNAPRDLFKIN